MGRKPLLPDHAMSAEEIGPVIVYTETSMSGAFGHNFPFFDGMCDWRCGEQIKCVFTGDKTMRHKAHGLLYRDEEPPDPHVPKAYPEQKKIYMCFESPANLGLLENAEFMARFDYEISYRRTAAAPTFYSEPYMNGMFDTKVRLFDPPVPFDKKVDAVAYMNSNCGTSSGRAEALRMLIELNQYPVHSYGDCDRNKYTDEDKVTLFSKYKFCVAMENSVFEDYISEKLFQAMSAGCVPLYVGATNIGWHMPVPVDQMMIHFDPKRDSIADLSRRLQSLGSNRSEYEKMLAWKAIPRDAMSPGFQAHLFSSESPVQCKMCQTIALDIERTI
ncbi:Fucosyltransferase [Plasmodiophora brassicae]|nr:hypothetical protein PBRA_001235 [Plasmodiophora brassicae]